MRKAKLISAIGAVVLLLGAGAVKFVGVPALRQLPADLDTTVQLNGTADLVDPAALQSGDMSRAVRTNVPVTVRERIHVASTHGSTAVVVDESTMTGADGTKVSTTENTWAVHRSTLASAPPPAGTAAREHVGLVVGFPLVPEPHDYLYWDSTTEKAVTADYVRTERRADRDTFVYEIHAAGPVKDKAILASVPPSLSKEAILGLANTLDPATRDLILSFKDFIPAQIPLTYTATSDTTFWVDRATGYVIDLHRTQAVAVALPSGFQGLSLPTKFTVELSYSPESVTASRDGAADAERSLFLLGTVAPLGLVLVGLVLAVVAIWPSRRRPDPEPAAPTPAAPTPAAPTPAAADESAPTPAAAPD